MTIMVMFYTQIYSMQNQSKQDSFTWKEAVDFFTPLGATAGSIGFYYKQKLPRSKPLGLFVGCCAAQQMGRFMDSSALNKVKWYFKSYKNTDVFEDAHQHQEKQAQKPWRNNDLH